jgi:CBS domain-containing protein
VKDVMTAKPICVRPEAPLEEAANLLLRLKIRRLPVVDEAGKLAGGWAVGLGSGRGDRRAG